MNNETTERAYEYAKNLADSLWRRYYRDVSPHWRPFDDVLGVLTQIDNMTAGLSCKLDEARASAATQAVPELSTTIRNSRKVVDDAVPPVALPALTLHGFERDDLMCIADSLESGYEKTVNVGNVTGEGDEHIESTTAAAAQFIRAILAASAAPAPEQRCESQTHESEPQPALPSTREPQAPAPEQMQPNAGAEQDHLIAPLAGSVCGVNAAEAAPTLICPRCKVDRFKQDCPDRIGCSIAGTTSMTVVHEE